MTQKPAQITFRHMSPSPAAEFRIQEEAADLDRFFSCITSCHVVVEAPHRHHQHGRGFHVNIVIGVPGSKIVVSHHPSQHSTLVQGDVDHCEKHLETEPDHKDLYVCIRDAFAAARRRLEDYARIMRGDSNRHKASAHA
jgi:ribosome-associated translation inhibitor RaiA